MSQPPRLLDHCVLPVPDLDLARARYEALGFTVAPQGTHPFGTINACVYFADDTFLEPLAVGDPARAGAAIADRNVFVARDALFRRAVGDNGFSALVFKTDDAPADHRHFEAAGISAGPMLDFSRDFVDSAGKSGRVSFRLAFAASPASDRSYFFTCQRIDAPPPGGRAALERHANGATGIAGIALATSCPEADRDFVAQLTSAPIDAGRPARLGKVELSLAEGERDLQLSAIRFAVADLSGTEAALSAGGIAFERSGRRLAVAPAPGQGATFIFEEQP